MDTPEVDPEQPLTYKFDVTDSTNDAAKRMAREGAASGSVFVADEQTAGRGRMHRRWASPRGGLWFSYLDRSGRDIRQFARINVAVGLATRELIAEEFGLEAKLAWPNDIMVRDKKIAGILTETVSDLGALIAGIGIDLNIPSDKMPTEVDKAATSVQIETGKTFDRDRLIPILQEKVARYLDTDLAQIEDAYNRYAYWAKGQQVKVERVRYEGDEAIVGDTVAGEVVGLDFQTGKLTVKLADGSEEALEQGTVRIKSFQ